MFLKNLENYYKNYLEKKLDELLNNKESLFCYLVNKLNDYFSISLTRHQLLTSLNIIDGNISELPTGQGKTFAIALAATYICLEQKKNVHVLTFNDYLAKRDLELLKNFFQELNISSSFFSRDDFEEQLENYFLHDIIYSSVEELGFFYMNASLQGVDITKRLQFAIIDEIDSILIDKNVSPMVLSEIDPQENDIFTHFHFVEYIINEGMLKETYTVDYKRRNIKLDDSFYTKLKEIFKKRSINIKVEDILLTMIGLNIHYFFHRGVEYEIEKNEIKYIDQSLGRIFEDIHFGGGIHEYLSLKEGVEIPENLRIVSKINVAGFVRQYQLIGGASGTAYVCRKEFFSLFGCLVIKQFVKTKRKKNFIFLPNTTRKVDYIIAKILEEQPRPFLIVTSSVQESIFFHERLKVIFPNVVLLHAKNVSYLEEDAIKNAGCKNSILVTTNLASRGVDIELGGKFIPTFFYQNLREEIAKIYQESQDELARIGGLIVIITQPSLNTRVDLQISGRTARKNLPGEVIFLCSTEDKIFDFVDTPPKTVTYETVLKIQENIMKDEKDIRYQSICEDSLIVLYNKMFDYLLTFKLHNICRILSIFSFFSFFKIKTFTFKTKEEFKERLLYLKREKFEKQLKFLTHSRWLNIGRNRTLFKKLLFMFKTTIEDL